MKLFTLSMLSLSVFAAFQGQNCQIRRQSDGNNVHEIGDCPNGWKFTKSCVGAQCVMHYMSTGGCQGTQTCDGFNCSIREAGNCPQSLGDDTEKAVPKL
ncbi:hypothetical protein BC833DRAFT_585745 [Globomyces pollinis-pini]|nr:hypothetical protein BC833DRAFT_585745 [Globomyces pollinis-pini]